MYGALVHPSLGKDMHPRAGLDEPDRFVDGRLEDAFAAVRLDDLAVGEEPGEETVGEHYIGRCDLQPRLRASFNRIEYQRRVQDSPPSVHRVCWDVHEGEANGRYVVIGIIAHIYRQPSSTYHIGGPSTREGGHSLQDRPRQNYDYTLPISLSPSFPLHHPPGAAHQ